MPSPRPRSTRRRWAGRSCTLLAALLMAGCSIPHWPVQGQISSPFGMRFMGTLPSVHHGVDIPLPVGTPVHAVLPGRVRFAGTMSGYGNVIWLEHSRGILSVYAHLDRIEVSTGAQVEHRARIGTSGATGNVTGPNLHFEIWKGGRPVDPVHFLGGRP